MRFSATFSSSLLLLALSGTAFAAAPSRPFLEVGSFAPASAKPLRPDADDAAVEAAARGVLADRAAWSTKLSLASGRTAALRDGRRIVKLHQTHEGLVVFGRGATVTFGADGLAHVVAQKLEEQMPSDVTPSIAVEDAAKTASDVAGLEMDPKSGKLMIWPTDSGNILAWLFYTPARAIPYAPAVIVDAEKGDVITHYNAAVTMHQASVFPSNPVKSPQTMNVTMPLPMDATLLSDPLVTVKNCIDKKTTEIIGGNPIHKCVFEQTAMADTTSLDFTQTPAADTEPEDQFGELMLYYHTHRANDYFRGFQANFTVQSGPIEAVANLRYPQGYFDFDGDLQKLGDVNLPLEPFSNAFFSPGGDTGGVMMFGQGPLKDFSYDADVIYHEFTHAVVNATIQLVYTPHKDAYGLVVSPSAMNEGLADYFSSALTGDPDVGEYTAPEFLGGTALRSLTAADKCPTAISGEEHYDSILFSAALWDVRSVLPAAQKDDLDLAVFAAMNAAPSGDLSFEQFTEIIRAEVASSPLGMTVATQITDAFTKRGVLPKCTRVLEYSGNTMQGPMYKQDFSGNAWYLPSAGRAGIKDNTLGCAPGVFQVHVPIPADAGTLDIEFDGAQPPADLGIAFKPCLFVRFSDEPIQFTYGPFGTTDDVIVRAVSSTGSVITTWGAIATFSAKVDVTPGATSAYVMIGSASGIDSELTNLTLSTTAAPPVSDEGSCSCSTPGSATGPASAALAALAAFAGLFARRRRR